MSVVPGFEISPKRLLASTASAALALAGVAVTAGQRAKRSAPSGRPLLGPAGRFTTPLLPDDYLSLINPLWSARELRGRVERVEPETDDAATVIIRPGWGWSYTYQPGQYVGIAVNLDGRWHWRSYSLTSPPKRVQKHIAITVKAMPEGFLSTHLVRGLAPGTIVRLALPAGEFVLPNPPPRKMLFVTAGSGITPVMAMLRTLDRRRTMPDVVLVHSAPTEAEVLFRKELHGLAQDHEQFQLVERHTTLVGRLDFAELDTVCPDWRDRQVWACGPERLLDDAESHWKRAGLMGALHLERFTPSFTVGGEGGHVTFATSSKEADIDGATTLLQAGEKAGINMPFGCRMGICHTCTVRMVSGAVRDLRNGEETSGENTNIQTCVTAAAGDCVLEV
ncbi:MAG: ferredoxin reductase [Mycobacterium sp.]|jgi:ferredoxin-NADP reductase|nr:ferredoxin reductase [Mycobacterium sp.]